LGLQTLENQTYLFCHFGVILLSFFCHSRLSFWICVVIFWHFVVICLSVYFHFGNGKMQKNPLKMTPSLGKASDDKKQQKMTKKRKKMKNK
jgi:hypothetical protein